jgi:hypothetical protein
MSRSCAIGSITNARSVESAIAALARAGRGEDVAASLFEAVVAIQNGRRNRATAGSIDLEQRGRLLTASVRARAGAALHLPASYPRAALNAGMWAIAYQVAMWAESTEKTRCRAPCDVLDFDDGAQIFRNELENLVLRGRTQLRKAGRSMVPAPVCSIQDEAAR